MNRATVHHAQAVIGILITDSVASGLSHKPTLRILAASRNGKAKCVQEHVLGGREMFDELAGPQMKTPGAW